MEHHCTAQSRHQAARGYHLVEALCLSNLRGGRLALGGTNLR